MAIKHTLGGACTSLDATRLLLNLIFNSNYSRPIEIDQSKWTINIPAYNSNFLSIASVSLQPYHSIRHVVLTTIACCCTASVCSLPSFPTLCGVCLLFRMARASLCLSLLRPFQHDCLRSFYYPRVPQTLLIYGLRPQHCVDSKKWWRSMSKAVCDLERMEVVQHALQPIIVEWPA